MASYNVHEAKSNLSQLLRKVEQGERVIIMRDGEPVAELTPCRPQRRKVQLGFAAGQVRVTANWHKPMTDKEVERLLESGC